MLGWDEKIQPGSADFQNFTHGFGFSSRESILDTRELI